MEIQYKGERNMYYKLKTDYGSPKTSIITIGSAYKRAKADNVPAIVINDNTMYAIQKAYDERPDEVKLIIGLELFLYENNTPLAFSVYPKNFEGYLEVIKLQTEAQKNIVSDENGKTYPTVTFDTLKKVFEGKGKGNVYLSTGGKDGIVLGILKKMDAEIRERQDKVNLVGQIKKLFESVDELSLKVEALNLDKTKYTALSKRKFDAERRMYEAMDNPPQEEVEDLLKRMDETEQAKEELKKTTNMIKARNQELKSLKDELKSLCGLSEYSDENVRKFMEDTVYELTGKRDAGSSFDVSKDDSGDPKALIKKELMKYKEIAGSDLLIDIENHGTKVEKEYMPVLCELAHENGIKFIASHTAVMEDKEDYMARKAMNSLTNNKWAAEEEGEREDYLKSEAALKEALAECVGTDNADEAVRNMSVLEECNVQMVKKEHYPAYPCTEYEGLTDEEVLARLDDIPLKVVKKDKDDDTKTAPFTRSDVLFIENTWKGAMKRLDESKRNSKEYMDRFEEELGVITTMGYSDYFLIVANFFDEIGEKIGHMPDEKIEYLREHHEEMTLEEIEAYIYENQSFPGLTVGFGRGSAAGSLVAYSMGIASIDPIVYGLLFSRFLSVARRSMPDVDSDLSNAKEKYGVREIVIDYCSKKYGHDSICGITTPQTLAARGVINAMGRVYGSYKNKNFQSLATGMSSLVANKPGVRLKDYRDDIVKKYGNNKDAMEILALSERNEGLNWNYGKHACGVIITGDGAVGKYAPLLMDQESGTWKIEMDAETAETRKYLKMDFLGLNTLNQLTEIARLVYKHHGVYLDMKNLPQEAEVYDNIFAKGLTNSVFQFESAGMKEMLKKFGKKTRKNRNSMNFEDIILLVACYRPGPLQYLAGIIDQRQGNTVSREVLARAMGYCKELKDILSSTNGDYHHYRQILDTFIKVAGMSEEKSRMMFAKAKSNDVAAKRDFVIATSGKLEAKDAEELFNVIGSENAVTLLAKTNADMRAIVEPTYFAMVFQEQVMITSQKLAGYSMGDADELRRAMGHKKMSVLVAERPKFVKGCVERGIDEEDADALFEEMLDFAKYAFNKSHAAAYAALSYCAAYLKHHYPTEFYTGTLNHIEIKKYPALINEAAKFGITVKAPDINMSKATFEGTDGVIYFGFSGIKGIGMDKALSYECGSTPYKSVADFVYRTEVAESMLKKLIDSGAFDNMTNNRAALNAIAYDLCSENKAIIKDTASLNKEKQKLEDLSNKDVDYLTKYKAKKKPSVKAIEDKIEELERSIREHKNTLLSEIIAPINIPENKIQRLENERELLNICVSETILDLYEKDESKLTDIDDLVIDDNVTIYGEVKSVREIVTKKGQKMCFLVIEDKSGQIDVTLFPKTYERYGSIIHEGSVLQFFGNVEEDKRSNSDSDEEEMDIKLQFLANSVEALEERKTSYTMFLKYGLSEWLQIYPDVSKYKTRNGGHRLQITSGVSDGVVQCDFRVDEDIMKDKKFEIEEV